MNKLLVMVALLPLFLAGCRDMLTDDGGGQAFKIIKDGKTVAEIVAPDNKQEEAIGYFNAVLLKCAQTNLPVVAKRSDNKNAIIFDIKAASLLNDDDFTIDFPNRNTLRITGSERSIRWGLNYILEECAGVVWLTIGETHCPILADLSIPITKIAQSPSFRIRREQLIRHPRHQEWLNGMRQKAPGFLTHGMTVDVFPAAKYADDQNWPVDIMPVVDGKKLILPAADPKLPPKERYSKYDSHWQPCWSNPKTVDIAVANILEVIAKNPDKKIICMMVNDQGDNWCKCPECSKVLARSGATWVGLPNYSDLYYAWLNKVAEKVCATHPDIYFNCEAYTSVLMPPGFLVHKNVLVPLSIDIFSMTDPGINENRRKFIGDWEQKVSHLGISDYAYGWHYFMIPRMYMKLHADVLKYIKAHNGDTACAEANIQDAADGPKNYIFMKLLWDVNLDVEKEINRWINAYVGAKSAPYLREYYQFWEDYSMGDEIKKTHWYSSKNGTYMHLGDWRGSHTFPLKKGDMAKCRKLMEQVVANAETPDQKRRAAKLMEQFEYFELCTTAVFSESLPPEGVVTDARMAVELIEAIPAAAAAGKNKPAMMKKVFGIPEAARPELLPYVAANICLITPYLDNPEVKNALDKVARNSDLPLLIKGEVKVFEAVAAKKPLVNLVKNGSFEDDSENLFKPEIKSAGRSGEYRSNGQWSLKVKVKDGGNNFVNWRIPTLSGKTYLFMVKVFMPENNPEALAGLRMAPGKGERNHQWIGQAPERFAAGKWNLLCGVAQSRLTADRIDVYLDFKNVNPADNMFIDEAMMVCLDDMTP